MKLALRVGEITGALAAIADALVTLSRLHALQLLAEPDRLSKLQAAERSSVCADLAVIIQDFATRHYQYKSDLVCWPGSMHPEHNGTLAEGEVVSERLAKSIDDLTVHIINSLTSLERAVYGTLMAAPVKPMIQQMRAALPSQQTDYSATNALEFPTPRRSKAHKTLTGPPKVQTDPIFKSGYSMLDRNAPLFGETLAETVPYLWTVCVGETMAAELCALSAIEYDGLPLAFYRDMAKQAWDEMRHAVYYLDAALAMLPAVEACLDKADPLSAALEAFRRNGRGLPIPREGNLYETVWNSTLEERLILFQIQTEAPGAARKKKNMKSVLCKGYPDLATALEYDLRDEITHARIGRTWLAYLYPDRLERKEIVNNTLLLRGVLLLTSFAHHGGGKLGTLMEHYLTSVVAS